MDNILYFTSPSEMYKWLASNHHSVREQWVGFYKKGSGYPSITWSESVDVALCFGWIDSKKIKIDEVKAHQFFSKRKQKSTWSKINKHKIEKLMEQGLMTEAGFRSIEIAKKNGSWTILDEVEELIIPADLVAKFIDKPDLKDYFLSLSKSAKKLLLTQLLFA